MVLILYFITQYIYDLLNSIQLLEPHIYLIFLNKVFKTIKIIQQEFKHHQVLGFLRTAYDIKCSNWDILPSQSSITNDDKLRVITKSGWWKMRNESRKQERDNER